MADLFWIAAVTFCFPRYQVEIEFKLSMLKHIRFQREVTLDLDVSTLQQDVSCVTFDELQATAKVAFTSSKRHSVVLSCSKSGYTPAEYR